MLFLLLNVLCIVCFPLLYKWHLERLAYMSSHDSIKIIASICNVACFLLFCALFAQRIQNYKRRIFLIALLGNLFFIYAIYSCSLFSLCLLHLAFNLAYSLVQFRCE